MQVYARAKTQLLGETKNDRGMFLQQRLKNFGSTEQSELLANLADNAEVGEAERIQESMAGTVATSPLPTTALPGGRCLSRREGDDGFVGLSLTLTAIACGSIVCAHAPLPVRLGNLNFRRLVIHEASDASPSPLSCWTMVLFSFFIFFLLVFRNSVYDVSFSVTQRMPQREHEKERWLVSFLISQGTRKDQGPVLRGFTGELEDYNIVTITARRRATLTILINDIAPLSISSLLGSKCFL